MPVLEVYIPEELFEDLKEIGRQMHRPVDSLAEAAIAEAIISYKNINGGPWKSE